MTTSIIARGAGRGTTRLTALVLAASTCSLLATAAFARNSSDTVSPTVTVHAPRVIQRSVGSNGIAVQKMSLTREVAFADLNLDTPEGKAALHVRIRENARQACEELARRYPSLIWIDDVQSCVQQAMLTWMPQVHRVSAAVSER